MIEDVRVSFAEQPDMGALLLTKNFDWVTGDPTVFGLGSRDELWLKKARPIDVFSLQGARVCSFWGVIISNDNRLVAEATPKLAPTHSEHSLFMRARLPRVTRCIDRAAVVFTDYINARNYAHWLFEITYRLTLLKSLSDWPALDAIIVNVIDLPFQEELFELAEVPKAKIVQLSPDLNLKINTLYICSHESLGVQPIPKWVAHSVRSLVLGQSDSGKERLNTKTKRIYISRGGRARRALVNETEVMELLSKRGFEVIYPEKWTVKEQARIFQDADCVAAAHGAGLANVVFCRRGARVLEFRAPFLPQYAMYGYLAAQCEVKYHWLDCKVWKPERIRNTIDPELWVDTKELEGKLQELFADRDTSLM
ncbi:glycosyltransferase family 61 protein [Methylacidimicrobium tartarophylax]|uniref:glycosyltransferase family 61 protein n=1 Tax=Methylacidimicrobium tartarophylax TaxID=1041768 RepID=UPI0015B4861F|nr:glycosyltransferase 61 family protein [Methylacidimicrobium tartarophylax]